MVENSAVNSAFKFDLITFAKNIIKEIEGARSYQKVTDEKTSQGFTLPTESRVNALFRLIGLPYFVVFENKGEEENNQNEPLSSGNRVLTPGYDSEFSGKLSAYKIKNLDAIGDVKIDETVSRRELELSKIENSIGTNETNAAMSSSLLFSMGLEPNIPEKGLGSGEIGPTNNRRTVYKKLKPLVPNYNTSGIFPKSNSLARPFLPDLRRQILDNQTVLAKPFIETVIRIRLVGLESSKSFDQTIKQIDYLDSVQNDLGDDLFFELFPDGVGVLAQTNALERFILDKMLTSINQLAIKWVELEKNQEQVRKKRAFKIVVRTTSAKTNPLGRRAQVETNLTTLSNYNDGKKIKKLKKQIAVDEALLSLLPTDDTVTGNKKNPKLSSTKNVVSSGLINSFTNILNQDLSRFQKELKKLQADISRSAKNIENLRVELDLMTGEFTGVSIPDIVAIIIGLFLISKKDLLNLLDQETRDNLSADPVLKTAIESLNLSSTSATPSSVIESVKKLETQVDSVFSALNAQIEIVRDRIKPSKLNKQQGRKKKENINRNYDLEGE